MRCAVDPDLGLRIDRTHGPGHGAFAMTACHAAYFENLCHGVAFRVRVVDNKLCTSQMDCPQLVRDLSL
mgnify:CR=1 FL=1